MMVYLLIRFTWMLLGLLHLFQHIEAEESKKSVQVCEGGSAQLKCRDGFQIKFCSYYFGRRSIRVCNTNMVDFETGCEKENVGEIVKNLCDGKQECLLELTLKNFKDPCPYSTEYFEGSYSCVSNQPSTTTSTEIITTPDQMRGSATTDMIYPTVIEPNVSNLSKYSVITLTSRPSLVSSPTSLISAVKSRPVLMCSSFIDSLNRSWPETMPNTIVPMKCAMNEQNSIVHYCLSSGEWDPAGPNYDSCLSDWVTELEMRTSSIIDIHAARTFAYNLFDKLLNSILLYPNDVIVLAKLLKDLGDSVQSMVMTPEPMIEHVKSIVNHGLKIVHLLTAPKYGVAWRILDNENRKSAISNILKGVDSLSDSYSSVLSNTVNKDTILYHQQGIYFESVDIDVDSIGRSVPTVASKQLSNYGATITKDALTVGLKESKQPTISIAVIQNLVQYFPIPRELSGFQPQFLSELMSVRVNQQDDIDDLKESVVLKFAIKQSSQIPWYPRCMYLDFDSQSWKSDGCSVRHSTSESISCSCNHLTHFAIVAHGEPDKTQLDHVQTNGIVISYVGCIITAVCMALFLLLQLLVPRSTQKSEGSIFVYINFCVVVLLVQVTYLLTIDSHVIPSILCKISTALLQYFWLVSLMWLFIMTLETHFIMKEIFDHVIRHKTKRTILFYLCCYAIPFIVVVTTLTIDGGSFGTTRVCWLNGSNYAVFSFIGPAVVIVLLALVALILTNCAIRSNENATVATNYYNRLYSLRRKMKMSLVIMVLHVTSITIGVVFLVNDAQSLILAYLFSIVNAIQGITIFILLIYNSKRVKKQWKEWFSLKDNKSLEAGHDFSHNLGSQKYSAVFVDPGSLYDNKQITHSVKLNGYDPGSQRMMDAILQQNTLNRGKCVPDYTSDRDYLTRPTHYGRVVVNGDNDSGWGESNSPGSYRIESNYIARKHPPPQFRPPPPPTHSPGNSPEYSRDQIEALIGSVKNECYDCGNRNGPCRGGCMMAPLEQSGISSSESNEYAVAGDAINCYTRISMANDSAYYEESIYNPEEYKGFGRNRNGLVMQSPRKGSGNSRTLEGIYHHPNTEDTQNPIHLSVPRSLRPSTAPNGRVFVDNNNLMINNYSRAF